LIPFREQVALALPAVAVRSATSYAWFGCPSRPLPRAVASAFPPGAEREYLIARIEQELYRSFYTQSRAMPYRPGNVAPGNPDAVFVQALSTANTGRGGWDAGWRVESVEGTDLQVARRGLRVRVRSLDCGPPQVPRVPGALVSVRRDKEHRSVSPGFYFALGDAEQLTGRDEVEVRVYFHVTAAGAAPLIAIATRLLNRAAIPFSLKVLDHPARFSRCDAAVLYLRDGDFSRLRGALRVIVSTCASHMRVDVPAFTRPLAPGVAVGEHLPRHGASFGTSRCRFVAEGIVAAHERKRNRLADRLDAVARQFAARGLDLDAPYLVRSPVDHYVL
jgi:hypothetical protein